MVEKDFYRIYFLQHGSRPVRCQRPAIPTWASFLSVIGGMECQKNGFHPRNFREAQITSHKPTSEEQSPRFMPISRDGRQFARRWRRRFPERFGSVSAEATNHQGGNGERHSMGVISQQRLWEGWLACLIPIGGFELEPLATFGMFLRSASRPGSVSRSPGSEDRLRRVCP